MHDMQVITHATDSSYQYVVCESLPVHEMK